MQLALQSGPGKLSLMGSTNLIVPKEDIAQTSVLIELPANQLTGGKRQLDVGVFSNGKLLQTLHTTFVGPRNP